MPEHHLLDLDSLPSAFEPCPECGDVMCQPDPWGEDCDDRARRRQAVATLEDQRRQAHALAAPAAAARARYKRLARRDEPHPDLVPALEEAIRLSCQRRDLLERIATDAPPAVLPLPHRLLEAPEDPRAVRFGHPGAAVADGSVPPKAASRRATPARPDPASRAAPPRRWWASSTGCATGCGCRPTRR